MDSVQIWEAIKGVVEPGNEDDEVDLKSEWYDLDHEEGKAKFLKHVCAMANSLSGYDDRRYIVFGVFDEQQCQDRDPAAYVKGVQSGEADKIKLRITDLADCYISPPLGIRYVEIQHPEVADKTLGVVEIRAAGKYDERPYVIVKGISVVKGVCVGKGICYLKESQVFVRRLGSVSKPANRDDIRRLVNLALEQEKESLELQLDELRSSIADALKDQETRLMQQSEDEISDLMCDRDDFASEKNKWRDLARKLCRRLHQRLSVSEREEMRELMDGYGVERDYDLWFRHSRQ